MKNSWLNMVLDIPELNPGPQEERNGRTIKPDAIREVLPNRHDQEDLLLIN